MATATDGNYWLKAVPNVSDVFYPSMGSIYGDDPNPRVNDFVKEFTAKQGQPPQTGYALFGAAVMDLWKKAVEQAKTTKAEPVSEATRQLQGRGNAGRRDDLHRHRPHCS